MRALRHSSRVPVLCIALLSFAVALALLALLEARAEALRRHRDEQALGLGAERVTCKELARGEDLPALGAIPARFEAQLGVERRRAPVTDGERAGHARRAREAVREA